MDQANEQIVSHMKAVSMNWLDNTTQGKLLLWNILLSSGLAASEIWEVARAAGGLVVGIVLVGLAQVLKMYRDHVSWKKDEERKEQLHQQRMKAPSPE